MTSLASHTQSEFRKRVTKPDLFGNIMELLDSWWDSAEHLIRIPPSGRHDTRATLYYSLGLLNRARPADLPRACAAIGRVLSLQWNVPHSPWHGTFARWPSEFPGRQEKKLWSDFDPNMREFNGCALVALLDRYSDTLPSDLISSMKLALGLAAEGAIVRRVTASYTNAAVMSAFLLTRAGYLHGNDSWIQHGLTLAGEIFHNRVLSEAFDEFNSPTYYGVDMCAVVQWNRFSLDHKMRLWGAQLEQLLWDDIFQFYHPRLRNLCGPYLRAYGMDMTRYCAIAGLWIARTFPDTPPPLPDISVSFDHAHDIAFAPLIAALAVQPAESCAPAMWPRYQCPRFIERKLPTPRDSAVTAFLCDSWMAGGLNSKGQFDPRRLPQAVPFTLHWLCPDGSTGWLRNAAGTALDATVSSDGSVQLTWYPLSSNPRGTIGFEMSAPGLTPDTINGPQWNLPGLDFHVQGPPVTWSSQLDRGTLVVTSSQHDLLSLTITLHPLATRAIT